MADQETGRAKFEQDVNRIFERNGIAFELKHGEVIRIAPTGLQEALAQTAFHTGDNALDEMLETARQKFLNRSLEVRRESLEKLWDAWERLKTIEPGKDKKAQVATLLAKSSKEPNLLARVALGVSSGPSNTSRILSDLYHNPARFTQTVSA